MSSTIENRSSSCVGLSLLIHGGLAAGLLIASAHGLIPEGTTPAEAVEITTMEVSQGQQVATTEPAPEIPETKAAEAVVPAKEMKKAKAKKAEVAQKLPPKEPVVKEEDTKTEATAVLPVVEENPDPATLFEDQSSEIKNAAVEEKAEENVEVKEDVKELEEAAAKTEVVEEKTEEKTEEVAPVAATVEEEQKVEERKEEVAPTPVAEPEVTPAKVEESVPAAAAEGDAKTAGAPVTGKSVETAQKASQAESDLPFGVPSGTRSYLDLKQRPGNVPPQYPTPARRKGMQGQTVLSYYVTAEGTVKEVKVAKSSGFAILDDEAVRAVSKYRYFPGQEGWTQHPVNYALKGPAQPMKTRLRTNQASR